MVIGDADMLGRRARLLGLEVAFDDDLAAPGSAANRLTVRHTPLDRREQPGLLDPRNARYVIATLEAAVDGCLAGDYAGMVTGPVQKSVINDAGIPFSGHTEFLQARSGVEDVVMLLAAGSLRVALVTTHLPLRAVADAIDQTLLERRLRILHTALRQQFSIDAPRILLCGLNPHAGESGHLGREEIDVFQPVAERLRGQGWQLQGPLPADTAFTPRWLDGADAVMAAYHDQGLPVLKHAGFGEAVNVTLGLPFVRTSVDHGTALDLAATGRAEAGSFAAALTLAGGLAG